MKKIYHLSTCDTCKRIIQEINFPDNLTFHDIKTEAITESQLEEMKALSGSYESLFSKRARLYKERDLKNQALEENDYKSLILEHYTFLKRPVIIVDENIIIGNSKKIVATAKETIHE